MTTVTLRFLASPDTVNFGGKVHGGTVMKWIDEAAYACASAWAKRYCVTVFVGGIRFHRPIAIGDIVEVQASLAYTVARSLNMAVEVRSGDLRDMRLEPTTECAVVFVAVDSHGRAVSVPAFEPKDEEGQALAMRVRRLLGVQEHGTGSVKASTATARRRPRGSRQSSSSVRQNAERSPLLLQPGSDQ